VTAQTRNQGRLTEKKERKERKKGRKKKENEVFDAEKLPVL